MEAGRLLGRLQQLSGREGADLTRAESNSDGEKEADSGCLLYGPADLLVGRQV